MKRIFIVNPVAGQGEASLLVPHGVDSYITKGFGDAERFVAETAASSDDSFHFVVYGGDGTLNEVVNGMMNAENPDRLYVSNVACGTGNDFARSFEGNSSSYKIDVIKYNDRYAVNLINIGFDCDVVDCVSRIKKIPFIKGSFAYIVGVANILCHKMGKNINFSFSDENGNEGSVDKKLLLCVIANASYYGGGFKAAPLATVNDGLLDLLTVDKISRRRFISLVGDYKKGLHINKDTRRVIDRFSDIMNYRRCKTVKINTPVMLCADGEISKFNTVDISVVPQTLNFISL